MKCLQYDPKTGDSIAVWRLDKPEEAASAFGMLDQLMEPGDGSVLSVIDLTDEQWAEAERRGEEEEEG